MDYNEIRQVLKEYIHKEGFAGLLNIMLMIWTIATEENLTHPLETTQPTAKEA